MVRLACFAQRAMLSQHYDALMQDADTIRSIAERHKIHIFVGIYDKNAMVPTRQF